IRLLDEDELPGEKVPEGHELRILGDELVRLLLERQADVDAEAPPGSGTLLTGPHDAPARAGDAHEAGVGDPAPEREGRARGRRVRIDACRAEDAHLAHR